MHLFLCRQIDVGRVCEAHWTPFGLANPMWVIAAVCSRESCHGALQTPCRPSASPGTTAAWAYRSGSPPPRVSAEIGGLTPHLCTSKRRIFAAGERSQRYRHLGESMANADGESTDAPSQSPTYSRSHARPGTWGEIMAGSASLYRRLLGLLITPSRATERGRGFA
jgi:hypothetical protein